MISLVIPTFNEERRISQTLPQLIRYFTDLGLACELIVVDDGSTDSTAEVVKAFKSRSLALVRLPENRGKGEALRQGVLRCRGDYICFVDADFPYAPEFFRTAIEKLRRAECEVVIGARNLRESERDGSFPKRRILAGRLYSFLVNRLLPIDIVDTQCGFKVFEASLLKATLPYTMQPDYTLDIELLLILRLWGSRIALQPVKLVNHHGSKIHLLGDSLRMLMSLLRIVGRYQSGQYPVSRPAFQLNAVSCPVCGANSHYHRGVVRFSRFRTCAECAAVFQNPVIRAEDTPLLYDEHYYVTEDVRSGYIDYYSDLPQQQETARWLWKEIDRFTTLDTQRILDVGCGSGLFLGENPRAGIECWGIDFVKPREPIQFNFVQGDFLQAELPSEFFDVVVFNDSFEHFHDPLSVLLRCREVMRIGGTLVVNTPNPSSWLARISASRWISLKQEHLVLCPPDVLSHLMRKCQFDPQMPMASRQCVSWEFLEPRLRSLSPLFGRIVGFIGRRIWGGPVWVPTGGMVVLARLDGSDGQ